MIEDVRKACKTIRNSKSPGPKNVPEDVIKYINVIINLYQRCLNKSGVSEE